MGARSPASFILGLLCCELLACASRHQGLVVADARPRDGTADWSHSVAADLPADADADGALSSEVPPEVPDLAPLDLPVASSDVSLGPDMLGLDGLAEAATPIAASSYGGCAPGVVTRSLAFYGTLGIDFDEATSTTPWSWRWTPARCWG